MRHLLLASICSICLAYCAAQDSSYSRSNKIGKRAIDTSILGKWPYVSNPSISNDGHFASFMIENQPINRSTLIIRGINTSLYREFVVNERYSPKFISGDNRRFVFKSSDTLYFLSLENNRMTYIPNISSFKFSFLGGSRWMAYQFKNSKELILVDLFTMKERPFSAVIEYSFGDSDKVLLLKTQDEYDNNSLSTLQWISLPTVKATTIWSARQSADKRFLVNSFDISKDGNQLVFMVKEINSNHLAGGNPFLNTIWYYKIGMERAVIKVNEQSPGVEDRLLVSGFPKFSSNNQWIFFELRSPADTRKPDPYSVKLNIWSYKDEVLQPEQIRRLGNFSGIRMQTDGPEKFAAVVSVDGKEVVRLERKDEILVTNIGNIPNDFAVVKDHNSIGSQYWWHFSSQPSFYVVSLKDGSRKLLRKNIPSTHLNNFSFSPLGRYLAFWDSDQSSYFSYEIHTGKSRNISKAIHSDVHKEYKYTLGLIPEAAAPVAGWQKNDSSLLIYDNYDIWEISPTNSHSAINITNGYGRKHQTKLSLVFGPGQRLQDKTSIVYDRTDTLLITAFNVENKYNGFFRKVLDGRKEIEFLTMGPCTYYRTESQIPYFDASSINGMQPIRARNGEYWMVERQSAKEAPNYFFTTDFKRYTPLSDLQPQEKFNWLTTELITWKQLDGTLSQGILYKPENFDPKKKYPVIFNYYRQLSYQLYDFSYPHFTSSEMNIPWFVSNGYLVFRPDIHYSLANKRNKKLTGESAFNTIVSAAQTLSKLPFISVNKMALQAHSFGAGQTNYLLTHTNLFAAASEFAGGSDLVSNFLTLIPFAASIEHYDKLSQTESTMGFTPWERPDLYRKASAVLNADKLTTPLLITHNMDDNQIQWRQGVELYLALRRLGKKTWLLQYEDGTHTLSGKDAVDFTIRLTQFFDYYLKNALPPNWMTRGIPARLKGIETGYELDMTGKKPQ